MVDINAELRANTLKESNILRDQLNRGVVRKMVIKAGKNLQPAAGVEPVADPSKF